MSQPTPPTAAPRQLELEGGAAIVAPAGAFQGGIPANALVVVPIRKPSDELTEGLKKGPMAVTQEQMWKLLGFNGPAVQVQDEQGRPIAIGLEDLLASLEKHWAADKDDHTRGRVYAQELMKHGRHAQAERVLGRIVASGGTGEDSIGLGVTQFNQGNLEDAEQTLQGAQNLLPESPLPALHLAKVFQKRGDKAAERAAVEKAIAIDGSSVDAWAYLYSLVRREESEEAAVAAVEKLAQAESNKTQAAPYVALQGFYSVEESTRDRALELARKAVERNPKHPLALISLSALHGQRGELDQVVRLLQPVERLMADDVRLANNYFEALFQLRQMDRVTKLLNALAGASNREVRQFAQERSRVVAQFLQQQQQQLAGAARPAQPAQRRV